MNDNLRELTFEEQITNMILHVLSIKVPFETKCDMIDYILGLSRIHEHALKEALNARAPQSTMQNEREVYYNCFEATDTPIRNIMTGTANMEKNVYESR